MKLSPTLRDRVLKFVNALLLVVLIFDVAFIVLDEGKVEAAPTNTQEAQSSINTSIGQVQSAASVIVDATSVNNLNLKRIVDLAVQNVLRAGDKELAEREDLIDASIAAIKASGSYDVTSIRTTIVNEVQSRVPAVGGDVVGMMNSISVDTAEVVGSAVSAADQLSSAASKLSESIATLQALQSNFAALASPTAGQIQQFISKATNMADFSSAVAGAAPGVVKAASEISVFLGDDPIQYDLIDSTFTQAASQLFSLMGNANGILGVSGGASTGAGGIPFGGLSLRVWWCTCSGGIAVLINDLTIPNTGPKWLLFKPGVSVLYPFYRIYWAGVWTLGLWRPGGVCLYWAGKTCASIPVQGTMRIVGTSK